MNRTYMLLAMAAVVGILGGGLGGSYFRNQEINWILVSLNIVLVVGIVYLASYKKDKEVGKEEISWAERKERQKKKKRK